MSNGMPVRHGPVRLLPDAAIDLAIANADEVLRRVGIQIVEDEQTLQVLADAGADVTRDPDAIGSGRVRWTLGAALDLAAAAPRSFVQVGRTVERSVAYGADAPPVFAPVYGPPNVIDDSGLRRIATMADYRALVALADSSAAIANTGHMLCVPSDVEEPGRYVEMARAHLELSAKPFMGSTANEASTFDVIRLVDSAWGPIEMTGSAEPAVPSCRLLHLCNSIPPLTWRGRMLGVLRASASNGCGNVVTSFQLLGATGPVAVIGALSQGIAEVILGVALSQLHRPGTPVLFGIYAVPFDMRWMAPRFGDPISHLVQSGAVQIARRFGLPALGYGGLTSSKVDDAQSGAESWMVNKIAIDVGADFILHSTGWLENGRTTGFAKFRREADALATELAVGQGGRSDT